jgi:hypothetical protein
VHGFTWKNQSKFTDPGAAGAVIDELPADLSALREASSQLVFHYRADGDWAENGVPAERAGEIDRSALCGVLAEIEALGLDLLELRKLG